MNTQSPATPELRPELAIINGEIKTTSLKIAEHFGKRHDTVLRTIKNLECSDEFRLRNFVETVVERENPSGGLPIKSLVYELTRDGFTFLAMGFTGAKAAQWKEAYITAFNRMEAELQSSPQDQPTNPDTITLTLTQAELDALVNERVAQAIPPSLEFAPEVLAAIESRAQALSLRHYDHTKKQIIKAIGQHGKSPDTAALVDFINRLGLPDSQLILVHRDTLWRVTNCFAALQKAFSAVDMLEKETGLDWYSKG